MSFPENGRDFVFFNAGGIIIERSSLFTSVTVSIDPLEE